MLKHSLQHPDREVRSTSQLLLQVLYEKSGFTVVEGIAMQLHPQILQAIKPKIPEVEKVILFLQKSKRVNNSLVYGSSGANGWLPTLKNRVNKVPIATHGGKQSSQRTLNYIKRKQLPIKNASATDPSGLSDSKTKVTNVGTDGQISREAQSKADPYSSQSDTIEGTMN